MLVRELAELAADVDVEYGRALVQVLIEGVWYNVEGVRVYKFADSDGTSIVLGINAVPVVK